MTNIFKGVLAAEKHKLCYAEAGSTVWSLNPENRKRRGMYGLTKTQTPFHIKWRGFFIRTRAYQMITSALRYAL